MTNRTPLPDNCMLSNHVKRNGITYNHENSQVNTRYAFAENTSGQSLITIKSGRSAVFVVQYIMLKAAGP